MTKNPHAVALGRKGGSSKSEAKVKASRDNGRKGGRPMTRAPRTIPEAERFLWHAMDHLCADRNPQDVPANTLLYNTIKLLQEQEHVNN